MSAEVAVKKRGRPKKVVPDSNEMVPATKKPIVKAKSTVAAPKITKAKKATSAKNIGAKNPASKPIEASESSQKVSESLASSKVEPAQSIAVPKAVAKSPVTSETSRILQEVRELSAKAEVAAKDTADFSNPSSTISTTGNTSPSTEKSEPSPNSKTIPPAPQNSITAPLKPISSPSSNVKPKVATPPKPSSPPSQPKPHVPLAAMNSSIVSQISERAGARPNNAGSKALPKNYKPVARKVTMAIVAMPIAIVTSYVLYQRLVLGEDRKLLVPPSVTKVEGADESKGKEAR